MNNFIYIVDCCGDYLPAAINRYEVIKANKKSFICLDTYGTIKINTNDKHVFESYNDAKVFAEKVTKGRIQRYKQIISQLERNLIPYVEIKQLSAEKFKI